MTAPVKIEVTLDGSQQAANQIGQLGNSIQRLPGTAQQAASSLQRTNTEMNNASQSAAMLGTQIGINLPRAVTNFIGQSRLMGTVLSSVFNFSIYAGAASGLILLVKQIGDQFGWWGGKIEETREKLEKSNEELWKYVEHVRDAKRAIETAGLAGSKLLFAQINDQIEDLAKLNRQLDILEKRRAPLESALAKTGGKVIPEWIPEVGLPETEDIQKATTAKKELNKLYEEEHELQRKRRDLQDQINLGQKTFQENLVKTITMEYERARIDPIASGLTGRNLAEAIRMKTLELNLQRQINAENWQTAKAIAAQMAATKQRTEFERAREQAKLAGIESGKTGDELRYLIELKNAEYDLKKAIEERQWAQAAAIQTDINTLKGMIEAEAAMKKIRAEIMSTGSPINIQGEDLLGEAWKAYGGGRLPNVMDWYRANLQKNEAGLEEEFGFWSAMRQEHRQYTIEYLKNHGQIRAAMGMELQDLDNIAIKYKTNGNIVEEVEKRKADVVSQYADVMADKMESFFNRVFLTARSFADVWHQLWGQIANFAVNQIARMVAAWWTGHQSMTQATVTGGYGGGGGSGGMAQGIQSVLAYGGAIPAMGIGATGGAVRYSNLTGLGINPNDILASIGQTGTGAVRAGIGSQISSFLTSPAGYGTLGMAGLGVMNAGIGRGNMLMGGLGGFFGGGFAGLALGSSLLAGTTIGAFAGPIGALVGLGIGLFMAARKRGQQKRASATVHGQYNEIQQQIITDYEQHKRGYDDAVSSLTSAYENAVMSLQSMGTPGSRTIGEISAYYKEGLSRMQAIQTRREGRLSTISGLPVPEFQAGSAGIIRSGSSRGFAAIIHPREAVLNERAAAALGDEAIKKLNSGKPTGGDTWIINLATPDTKTMKQWMEGNKEVFVKMFRRAARDSGASIPF